MNRLHHLAVLLFLLPVGCWSRVVIPTPTPTPQVRAAVPTSPPEPTTAATLPPDPIPTTARPRPTSAPRTPILTPVRATSAPKPTATRPAPTVAPPAGPPGTFADGNYASSAGSDVTVKFNVSSGGTVASGGYFYFHCSTDGALSTYGFTDSAAIDGGKFQFSAVNNPPLVTMACTATTSTQARCTIKNLLPTRNCQNLPATASRK